MIQTVAVLSQYTRDTTDRQTVNIVPHDDDRILLRTNGTMEIWVALDV